MKRDLNKNAKKHGLGEGKREWLKNSSNRKRVRDQKSRIEKSKIGKEKKLKMSRSRNKNKNKEEAEKQIKEKKNSKRRENWLRAQRVKGNENGQNKSLRQNEQLIDHGITSGNERENGGQGMEREKDGFLFKQGSKR